MNKFKKSVLIALCIGDGYITHQKQIIKGKTYQYNYLEISHGQFQKDYILWKANLCKKLTGRNCRVREKKYLFNNSIGYTFTCTAPYFRVLRKWLYHNNKKVLDPKYLSYLEEQGLAIWYMDDGSTYVGKKGTVLTIEFSTHIPKLDAEKLIVFFKNNWGIQFYLHKAKEDQYNIRTYSKNALKFIKLIEPFVPDCMAYKLIVPKAYFQECAASHIQRIVGMKIYSEQQ